MAVLDKKAIITARNQSAELITEATLTNVNPDTESVTDQILSTAIQKLNGLTTNSLVSVELVESRNLVIN